MKKSLTIALTLLSLVIILDSLNAGHAIVMFLLAGIIPGTNIAISGAQMLEFFALALGFTLSRLASLAVRHSLRVKRHNTLSPKLQLT